MKYVLLSQYTTVGKYITIKLCLHDASKGKNRVAAGINSGDFDILFSMCYDLREYSIQIQNGFNQACFFYTDRIEKYQPWLTGKYVPLHFFTPKTYLYIQSIADFS